MEERRNLTAREYYALRAILGATSTIAAEEGALQKRLGEIPMGRCDMKLIEAKAAHLLEALLRTVPPQKLGQIRQEIDCARVEVHVVRDVTGKHQPAFTYVPAEDLEWLEEQIVGLNCTMCERSEKESRRCPVRRHIEALYQYDFPERTCCPLARMNLDK